MNRQTHTEEEQRFVNSIGRRIQLLRKKKWMSQSELAEKAGLSVNTICNLESSTPFGLSMITVYKIARALNIDPIEILQFE